MMSGPPSAVTVHLAFFVWSVSLASIHEPHELAALFQSLIRAYEHSDPCLC